MSIHLDPQHEFSTTDEQTKWPTNPLKYHIESLLQ